MRLHGNRDPETEHPGGPVGGGKCSTGADNEIWSFGPKAEAIITELLFLRERMRPYITSVMKEAHELGRPVIRPLFYQYPDDAKAWDVEDEFMFGGDLLAAPILHEGQRERSVYLPTGDDWIDLRNGARYTGGQTITSPAPIESIPVFARAGAEIGFDWIRNTGL